MTAARIYADHASTTPLRPEAAAVFRARAEDCFNPSSLHVEGRRARAVLDDARDRIARVLHAKPGEVVFTGSGSEADNLAVIGAARAQRCRGRHVISTPTEHRAVLRALDALRDEGYEIALLDVDGCGRIDLAGLERTLRPDTVLVSLALGNNEVGTVHPIAEAARLARAAGVAIHTDAVQAAPYEPLDVGRLGVDLRSLSGHKVGGPKGVGVLYVREGTPLTPITVGGSQERARRAGTENVAGIAAFATALELAARERENETARLRGLRDRFEAGLTGRIGDVAVTATEAPRLPHISSVAFRGIQAAELLARLDLEGIAASAGSACAAGAPEPSHVLEALGAPDWVRRGTVRFSFGRLTAEQDLTRLLTMLPDIVASMRVAGAIVGTTNRAPAAGSRRR